MEQPWDLWSLVSTIGGSILPQDDMRDQLSEFNIKAWLLMWIKQMFLNIWILFFQSMWQEGVNPGFPSGGYS